MNLILARGLTPKKRILANALVGVTALGVVGGAIAVLSASRQPDRTPAPAASLPVTRVVFPKSGAYKAGDLVVTPEALELAEIKLGPALERSVAEKLQVNGTVEAGGDRLVKVTPRVAGKVISLNAGVGDAVRAGQTLGLIESSELAQAQAAYRQARSKADVARNNLRRQRELASLGVFGRPKVEEARTRIAALQGEVSNARGEAEAARAEVGEAKSQIQALQAVLDQAQTQVGVAHSRFRRAELLLEKELTSRQEWEGAKADHERAQADVRVARANLDQGRSKVETAQARLRAAHSKVAVAGRQAEIASQALGREERVYRGNYGTNQEIVAAEAAVRQAQLDVQAAAQAVRLLGGTPGGGSTVALATPISGRVQERNVSRGQTVDTEHDLFTVINLDQVWAQLAVAPNDLSHVRPGQRVELTAETAPGRVFTGTVSAIGNTADEATRTVRVRSVLTNPGGALRPGTFVRGSIVTDLRQERVTVPPDALQDHTGKPTVYVSKGEPGLFEVRHVTLGVRGNGWREISSGLKGGEPVAVNGTFYLKSEALKSSLSDGCCAVPKKE